MELVEEAVPQRGQKDGNRADENHSAKQGVERGEQFTGDGAEFAHRPHSGQDHRGVQEGVQPGEPFAKVVSDNSQRQGNPNDAKGERQAAQHPKHESFSQPSHRNA